MNKVNLKKLFGGLQEQMLVKLTNNREFIPHPSSKGDALENTWIEWLRNYLPNRYCVNKAFIIDSEGSLSDQIDLVIYDQHFTPFVFTQNDIHYIPAEGVYAVFEIKPDLQGSVNVKNENISYIEYAGRKIESVRSLKRTSTTMIDRGVLKPPRPLTKILGGILTSTNDYKKTETIEKHLKNLKGLQSIDIGCAVSFGSFYVDYKGVEDDTEKNFNTRIRRYYKDRAVNNIEFSSQDTSLVTFFFQLMRYLQQSIGTVAAIDLNEYSKAINFSIDNKI